ncbi:hypothetical protein D047_3808B, partial [Vibrio parahaemolyticus VPTS-2010_2]
ACLLLQHTSNPRLPRQLQQHQISYSSVALRLYPKSKTIKKDVLICTSLLSKSAILPTNVEREKRLNSKHRLVRLSWKDLQDEGRQ